SRRVGHCGNHRSADALYQRGCYRRPRPISDTRASAGDLHGLGTRLWFGGFAEDPDATREADRPEAFRCAEPDSRCAVLSGELLVRAAKRTEGKRVSGHGPAGKWDFYENQDAGTVAASDQDG